MVKSTEKDMFDDSIQILKEKTKVYDIDTDEIDPDDMAEILELHLDNWDTQFDEKKPEEISGITRLETTNETPCTIEDHETLPEKFRCKRLEIEDARGKMKDAGKDVEKRIQK